MGEISRFMEAAIITAVFAAGAFFVNYPSGSGCGKNKAVAARIERGPSRVFIN